MQTTTAGSRIEGAPLSIPPGDAAARVRIHSIDVLRGIVMTLMALDHVRD